MTSNESVYALVERIGEPLEPDDPGVAVDPSIGLYLVPLPPTAGDVRAAVTGMSGVVVATRETPDQLARHLRALTRVRAADGTILLFRYYDPHVLRVLLPTCSRDQLEEFFGPVSAFVVPEENSTRLIAFRYEATALQQVDVEDVLGGGAGLVESR